MIINVRLFSDQRWIYILFSWQTRFLLEILSLTYWQDLGAALLVIVLSLNLRLLFRLEGYSCLIKISQMRSIFIVARSSSLRARYIYIRSLITELTLVLQNIWNLRKAQEILLLLMIFCLMLMNNLARIEIIKWLWRCWNLWFNMLIMQINFI